MTNEGITDLGQIKKHIQSAGACKWNISESGIKIFFDVTPVSSMIRPGSSDKSVFGVGISLVAMLTNKVLHAVNHVGFILSDGSIIHATTGKGVVRESGDDIINNPRNYIVVNVGGSESDLIKKFESLKKTLYVDKDSYDWKGIVRQFPVIGKLLARFKWSENKPYRFFCSELVANLLVRCGIIKFDELAVIHEKLTQLDKYDEIDPTKLFLLIKDKADLCPVVCDANLNKENIMTKSELKELIKEVIREANTKELQKLGYKPTKSDINEVKGFILHWNSPENHYMMKHGVMKPKMHSQFKRLMNTRTMKYDDLVKAFPKSKDIQLRELPPIKSLNTGDVDYYVVDSEGDVVTITSGDIGSGLD